MDTQEVIARRIQQLCQENNVTPNKMSKISGVPQATIKSYHDQIEADKVHAQQIADKSTSGTQTSQENPAVPKADGETTEGPEEEAAPGEAAEEEFVDEGGE